MRALDEFRITPHFQTADSMMIFAGEDGRTYEFICIATDTAGNTEVQEPGAEAATQIIIADIDDNCEVDLDDYAIFARCMAGPNVTTPPTECTQEEFDLADLDDDGDVDLGDFADFERAFNAAPIPILSPEWIRGCIDPADDTDAYTFTGEAGDLVFIQMNRMSGGLNPRIELYPPDGGALEAAVQGGSVALLSAHPLAQSWEYTIVVRDEVGDDTGEYMLSLTLSPQAYVVGRGTFSRRVFLHNRKRQVGGGRCV